MSISDISIPDISIPNISVQIIPPVRVFGGYISHPSFSEPSLLLPGCYKTHRDADKNSNLVKRIPPELSGAVRGVKYQRYILFNMIVLK